MNLTLRKIFNS